MKPNETHLSSLQSSEHPSNSPEISMKNPVQPGKRRKRRVKPDEKRGNGRNIHN